jgi:hypothetical protein
MVIVRPATMIFNINWLIIILMKNYVLFATKKITVVLRYAFSVEINN